MTSVLQYFIPKGHTSAMAVGTRTEPYIARAMRIQGREVVLFGLVTLAQHPYLGCSLDFGCILQPYGLVAAECKALVSQESIDSAAVRLQNASALLGEAAPRPPTAPYECQV